jgi:hypothetical protein
MAIDPVTGQEAKEGVTPDPTETQSDKNWREVVGRKQKELEAVTARLAKIETDSAAAAKAAAEKEMTEVEKAKARVSEIEKERDGVKAKVKDIAVRAEIRVQAIKAGVDPDLAIRLADLDSVSYDEASGTASGADAAVKAIVAKYPQVAGAGLPAGGTPDNVRGYRGGSTITESSLAKLGNEARQKVYQDIRENKISVVPG